MTLVPYDDAPPREVMILAPCPDCDAPAGQHCGRELPSGAWIADVLHWHAARVEDATAPALLTP